MNKTIHITATCWHELTHASQLQRMKLEKGYRWASDYWSAIVYQEAWNEFNMGGNVYANKGDCYWEIIALAEGWANYREEYMAKTRLPNASSYVSTKNAFLSDYVSMFRELRAIGCSFTNMEKSLSTYTIAGFRNKLISKYPHLNTQITNIIATRL